MTDQSQPSTTPEAQEAIAAMVNQFAAAAEGKANDAVVTAVAYFMADVLATMSPNTDALETNIALVANHVGATARQRYETAR